MKKITFLLLSIFLSNALYAGNLRPAVTQAFMDQVTKDFSNPSFNKARLNFYNKFSSNEISEKQLKSYLLRMTVVSNSDCDLCLKIDGNSLAISGKKNSYRINVNGQEKTFTKKDFSLKSFNQFINENLKNKRKTTQILDFLIPSAHALSGRKFVLNSSAITVGIAGTAGGFLAVASAPLWMTGGLMAAAGVGFYGMYRTLRFEMNLGRVKTGMVCCDMVKDLAETGRGSNEKLEDALKELQGSCIEDISKFTSALGEKPVDARVEINELGAELSSDLKKLGDTHFVKESIDYFMQGEVNANNIFARCIESEESLKTFEIDDDEINPDLITEKGKACRARFRDAFNSFRETPRYKVTQVANQCRAKMREVAELEKSGDKSFNGRRRQFVNELKSLQETANQFERSSDEKGNSRAKRR